MESVTALVPLAFPRQAEPNKYVEMWVYIIGRTDQAAAARKYDGDQKVDALSLKGQAMRNKRSSRTAISSVGAEVPEI